MELKVVWGLTIYFTEREQPLGSITDPKGVRASECRSFWKWEKKFTEKNVSLGYYQTNSLNK